MHLGVLMLGVYKFTIIILDELIFFAVPPLSFVTISDLKSFAWAQI